MKNIKLAITAGCGALTLLSAAANAAVFRFTLAGDAAASWQIDTATPPFVQDDTTLSYAQVTGNFPGAGASGVDIDFFTGVASPAGGLRLTDFDSGAFLWFNGPVLYTGNAATLAFATGTFALTDVADGTASTLAIAEVAGVPEPTTWMMLILGFGAIGATLRRGRRRSSRRALAGAA